MLSWLSSRVRSLGRALRFDIQALPAFVAVVLAVAFVIETHLFFIKPYPTTVCVDEEYVNAFATRMIHGRWLPYVDAVSHRGPVLYWTMALVDRLFGTSSWTTVRVTALAANLVVMLLTFLAALRARRPLAGAVAVLTIAFIHCARMEAIDGIGLNGEILLDVFSVAAFFCVIVGLEPASAPRQKWLLAAGILSGLGVLAKQVGATHVAALLVWILAAAVSRPGLTRGDRGRVVGSFVLGTAIPVLAVVSLYAAVGELRTFIYWTVIYNAKVYMHFHTELVVVRTVETVLKENLVLLGVGSLAVAWGLSKPILRARHVFDLPRAYDEAGFIATTALQTIAGLVGGQAAMRGWYHYFIQAVPWCGLLLGSLIDEGIGRRLHAGRRSTALAHVVILACAVAFVRLGISEYLEARRGERRGGGWPDHRNDALCKLLHERTTEKDSLFIWGFRPNFYTSCNRRPASRFVYTTLVAGLVPWFKGASKEEDDSLAAPGSREQLVEDLEKNRPPIILDWPDSLGDRPMARYEVLARYLEGRYCSIGKVGTIQVYGRKGEDGSCPKGLER
jgi:Dolichyl-phosphate-mannose-protein mannosyltransferase